MVNKKFLAYFIAKNSVICKLFIYLKQKAANMLLSDRYLKKNIFCIKFNLTLITTGAGGGGGGGVFSFFGQTAITTVHIILWV